MDWEGRFETLEATVERLVQGLNHIGFVPNPSPRHYEDRSIRIDIPDFDGHTHNPSHYLEWEERMDQYFEYQETPPERQYKMAKVKMTKLASTWLEGL